MTTDAKTHHTASMHRQVVDGLVADLDGARAALRDALDSLEESEIARGSLQDTVDRLQGELRDLRGVTE